MASRLVFIIASIFSSCFIHGQSAMKNYRTSIQVGYPLLVGFDSPAPGLHLGIHPIYRLRSWLAAEGQLSYVSGKFRRDDGIFQHDGGSIRYYNAMAGPRIYFLSESSKWRLAMNLLIGYVRGREQEYRSSVLYTDQYSTLNSSLGLMVEKSHTWTFGASLEGPTLIGSLKIGYAF
jgi:hypothetical protein